MMRDITLGQYYPVQSPVHKLDPRTKLFGTLVLIAALFVADNLFCYILAAVFLFGTIRLSKVPVKHIAVSYTHLRGISVEAELGTISDADRTPEEIALGYTDPEIARRFVKDTGIDCLAVSIGTAHGVYKYTPKINFDLLKELIDTVSCPIVVHGGSGTPDEDVTEMVRMGIAKLNVGTDFFIAYNEALYAFYKEHGARCDIADALETARTAVEKVAEQRLDILTQFRV